MLTNSGDQGRRSRKVLEFAAILAANLGCSHFISANCSFLYRVFTSERYSTPKISTNRDPSCRNPSSTTCSSGATSRSRAQRIFKNYDQPRPPLRFTPTHRSPGDRVGLVVGAAPRDDKIECRLVGFTRSAGNDRLKGAQGVSSRLASECRSTTRPHGQALPDNMTVVGALRKMLFKCRALMTEIKDLLRRPTTLLAPSLGYTNTRFVSRWSTFAARQIWQMLHRERSGHGPCSSPRHKSSCTCSGRRWDRRSAQTRLLAGRVQWFQDLPLRSTVVTVQLSTASSSIGRRSSRFVSTRHGIYLLRQVLETFHLREILKVQEQYKPRFFCVSGR